MKFKEMTEEQLDDLGGIIDNEGFWYALTEGFIKLNDILNPKDCAKVEIAIALIQDFERSCSQL